MACESLKEQKLEKHSEPCVNFYDGVSQTSKTTFSDCFQSNLGLPSDLFYYGTFIESNSPDIFTLSEANRIQKDTVIHLHDIAVYVKRDFFLRQTLDDSSLYFRITLLHSAPYLFCLCNSPSSFLQAYFLVLFQQQTQFT